MKDEALCESGGTFAKNTMLCVDFARVLFHGMLAYGCVKKSFVLNTPVRSRLGKGLRPAPRVSTGTGTGRSPWNERTTISARGPSAQQSPQQDQLTDVVGVVIRHQQSFA
jgi:hypothetical protein